MNREEAAGVLKAQADYYGKLFESMVTAGDYSELRELEKRMEALEIGADALRDPTKGWMRTKEKIPTGGTGGYVLAWELTETGDGPALIDYRDVAMYGAGRYPYWMHLPPLRDSKPKPAQHEQVSPTTHICPEKRTQSATTDACDRLRWLLTQAERVVRVDNEDRVVVDRACRLMADIDSGFDRVRE